VKTASKPTFNAANVPYSIPPTLGMFYLYFATVVAQLTKKGG
jgi:hypothetical protein